MLPLHTDCKLVSQRLLTSDSVVCMCLAVRPKTFNQWPFPLIVGPELLAKANASAGKHAGQHKKRKVQAELLNQISTSN